MLDLSQNLEEISLEGVEYAHLAERQFHFHHEFKVHIPKIMPDIPFGTATSWTEGVDGSIFMNAQACGIKVNTTITCQNFLTRPRYPRLIDSYFKHRADIELKLNPGTVFIANPLNSNYSDIWLEEVL